MDYHLEHGLRLELRPEKRLYAWAINEVDAQGQQIGHDQIPWPWTLRFSATSLVLGDGIEIKAQYQKMEEAQPRSRHPRGGVLPEIEHRQVISVPLRPEDGGDFFRRTKFFMFGTDRVIKSFHLDIRPIANPAEQESCTAWGCVSYTYELDFRNKTEDDCIIFSLSVTPETFGRYAAKVAHGLIDEMILSVSSVAGFYSEWNPSISTSSVKVLAPAM